MAAPSKALVYGRSLRRIACSNPAGGMDVLTSCVLPGRGLCDGLITPPGVQPSAVCLSVIVMPR